jgi:Mce-associated membrane protein
MTSSDPSSSTGHTDGELARQAEAEATAAEARAEAARARAEELRSRLQATSEAETRTAVPTVALPGTTAGRPNARLRLVAGTVAALLTAGLLAATGYMLWQHHDNTQQRRQAAEYAAAARQGVINLMSIDYTTAQESVQRVLDGSTGRFRDNFADTADDFVQALKDEKIITKVTVNDTAVESMTSDTAVVLVSATSRREGAQSPKDQQEPRLWRVVLSLEHDGDQIKVSGVDFV